MMREIHDGQKVTEIKLPYVIISLSTGGTQSFVQLGVRPHSSWMIGPEPQPSLLISSIDLQALGPEISIARQKSSLRGFD